VTLSRRLKCAPVPLALLLLCLATSGCGSGSRAPVEGTVSLDGAPVDGGFIIFAPTDYREGQVKAVTAEIKGGKYSLDAAHGPVPGTYRVQIVWEKKTGQQIKDPDTGGMKDEVKDYIPEEFNSQAKTVEINPSGNKFDYAISTKGTAGGKSIFDKNN